MNEVVPLGGPYAACAAAGFVVALSSIATAGAVTAT